MSKELRCWSATEMAAAIEQKTVSSREIIEAHLDRIDEVNRSVNAITHVCVEGALTAAGTADTAVASGRDIGPLHGVPITVKENIDVAGSATTQGLPSLRNAVASTDAPVVRHLKDAGAIVIGRSNMPDLGLRWHTDNDLHGATVNPWDATRTPGGSSGGEAVAIATGMSPLGIGNDMAGSTRQPAVNCGIMGMRPSTGRVSRAASRNDHTPTFYVQVACVNGPMARCIDDLRLALAVMARPDPSDPVWMSANASPFSGPDERRVGLVRNPSGDDIDAAIEKSIQRAAAILGQAGYDIEEIDPPLIEEAEDTIQCLSDLEMAGYLDDVLPLISEDAAKVLRAIAGGPEPDAAAYRDAIARRHDIAADWNRLMEDFPLIIGPVSTREAFPVGYDTEGPEAMRQLIRSFRLTELCNLLGLPSIALPVLRENDLPQGIQIIGRRFDEDRCFEAAKVIEAGTPTFTPIDPVLPG